MTTPTCKPVIEPRPESVVETAGASGLRRPDLYRDCKSIGFRHRTNAAHPVDQLCLQRGAEHLHRCGPRAVAELLADVARRIGGGPAIMAALNDYERITAAMLRTSGKD